MASESSKESSDSSRTISNSPLSSPISPSPPPHPKTFKCIECFSPFPNRDLLGKHHREDEPCSIKQKIRNMNKTSLNMIGNFVPVLQPQPPPPSPPTPPPADNERTLATSFLITNPAGENVISGGVDFLIRFHPYLRQDYNPLSALATYDRCPSPDNRTLDLISQMEPTRNFLCLIENQPVGPSGNAAYGANAPTSRRSIWPVDLTLKL
ncbi:hypothetical protein RIF29_25207 [Crotalaria pallida]|uniref:Uncharacterized protein n=1 Tax=Crotalaria pallida TaxID=3830 RepID=A0AAN9HX96_CROPI